LELIAGRPTGRLYEEDAWLRQRVNSEFPNLCNASKQLASYGITGLTDASPGNGGAVQEYFQQSQKSGHLLQRVRMMGSEEITDCQITELLRTGELKIHLLESQLPEFDSLCERIDTAHDSGRAVAVHCVTITELVFTLSAFERCGVLDGDRIEHASVTPYEQLQIIQSMGLRVITQPHFVLERGDQYLNEVDAVDQPWLYRCASFINAGIPLAAGSDAPFGSADPWLAMNAAVQRQTHSGELMGGSEALSPEQALVLYLSKPESPGMGAISIEKGMPADLCLLKNPWSQLRNDLNHKHVRRTWLAGALSYDAS
ncbi:MAG: amidohydrolase family protein, partial [Pseudomonadales bacterium]